MTPVLREIQVPQKSYLLLLCDLALEPLNIVCGHKKIVFESEIWLKQERIKNIFINAISFVYCCVFSPLILTAIIVKASSEEYKWVSQAYSLWKKQMFFRKKGYKIKHTGRISADQFSLTLSKNNNESLSTNSPLEKHSFTVVFDSYGKLKYKNFF